MSVRKKDNGKYEVRWSEGRRKRGRVFDRQRDAEKFDLAARRTAQLGGVVRLVKDDPHLEDFVADTFWPQHVVPNLAPSTRSSYELLWVNHLLPRVGDFRLREFDVDEAYALRTALIEDPEVGAATARRALALMQSVLAHAKKKKLVEANVLSDVKPVPYEREREPMIFTPADVEAVRSALEPRSATLVSLLAYAGPRPEEALRLRWEDVGAWAIKFRDTKRGKVRFTPLIAPLAEDLKAWREQTQWPDSHHPVIPTSQGQPFSDSAWRNWRARTWKHDWPKPNDSTEERAKRQPITPVGSRPRDLRSSYVTVELYAGTPLTTIAHNCGTSVAMIDRHYSGCIANWDGERTPADEQIRAARERRVGVAL